MSSEERDLPASQQKLRRAREKGQVARSADLNAAALLITTIVYVFVSTGPFLVELKQVWALPFDFRDAGRPETLRLVATGVASAVLNFLGPLFGAAVAGVIAAEAIMKRGIVLSFEPLAPKFDAVNPMTGFQNLFSLRRFVDLLKALIKFAALCLSGGIILAGTVKALIWLPRCGETCVAPAFAEVARLICGAAIAVFAVNGLLDMRMQAWLFNREQRMSKTERKQEQKNNDQSPEIKREIARQSRGDANATPIQMISLIIGDDAQAIAVRYVDGEMPAPMCVMKVSGKLSKKLISAARKRGVAVEDDPAFVNLYYDDCQKMGFMPSNCFGALSVIFKKHSVY